MMPPDPSRESSAGQLAWYLFGNPLDPADRGILGRLSHQMDKLAARFDRVLRPGWALFIVFVVAVLGLVANLVTALVTTPGVHRP